MCDWIVLSTTWYVTDYGHFHNTHMSTSL